jgi:hypothetical protein
VDEFGLTHVQSTHERDSTVHDTELLVMSPVQHAVSDRAVQRAQGIRGSFGKSHWVDLVERQACKTGDYFLLIRRVIGMSKHPDVGMQGLQGMFGVLGKHGEYVFELIQSPDNVELTSESP